MQIQNIISKLPELDDVKVEHGFILESREEIITAASEVIAEIKKEPGCGWLCAANYKDIIRLDKDSIHNLPDDLWPICAEIAYEQYSLHIFRTPDGWLVAKIIKKSCPYNSESFLIIETFQARDSNETLKYEVLWEPVDVFGLTEFHPTRYRFLGLSNKNGGKNNADSIPV